MRLLHALPSAAVSGCLLTLAPSAFAADGEDTPLRLNDKVANTAVESSAGGGIVRTIIALLIVLAVIYGLYWALKQIKASKAASAAGEGLETLATLPLGTNRALHLVRAGRELVLFATADNAVAPIRRYSEDEARELGLIGSDATLLVDEPVGATLASLEAQQRPKGLLQALRSRTVIK